MIIDSLSNPNEVGDEAVLLSNKTQSTVVSSSNRVQSTKFCDTSEVDFIIHDDGLQHYSLNRQYEFIIEKILIKGIIIFFFHVVHSESQNFFTRMRILFSVIILALNTPGFYSRISGVWSSVDKTKYDLDDKKFSSCILITAIADDFSLVKEL